MTRYTAMFERCRNREEGALGAFLMLGDPGIADCEAYLDALVAGGADMVELGIPFSDPIADGPVIQAAAARALGILAKGKLDPWHRALEQQFVGPRLAPTQLDHGVGAADRIGTAVKDVGYRQPTRQIAQ